MDGRYVEKRLAIYRALKHRASQEFWALYYEIPVSVKQLSDKSFVLRFWSARVGLRYRVVGVDCEGIVLWFWIGGHAEYGKLV